MREQPFTQRLRLPATVLLAGYWLALFIGTHVPKLPEVVERGHADKWLHFGAYFGLAILVCLNGSLRRSLGVWTCLAIVAGLTLFGAFDEISQPLVGRDCELLDWAADTTGVLTGVALFLAAGTLWRRPGWFPSQVNGLD